MQSMCCCSTGWCVFEQARSMKKAKSNFMPKWLGVLVVIGVLSIAASVAWKRNFTASNSLSPQQQQQQQQSKSHNVLEKKYLTDAQLLQEAADAPQEIAGAPRIAFLFIVRGEIPHEPLWKRFFHEHEERYALYVHAAPGYVYPRGSIFEGREVPSKPCTRYSRSIIDALRRLISYAMLDIRYNNVWFVNVCESSIPIRGFLFVYDYLMSSKVSFVESFFPVARYHSWNTLPEFRPSELRKGELWMALRREHAQIAVSDSMIYFKFLAGCSWWCTWDEQYLQTLLHLRDADGIAERTVMYVNWTSPHGGSPNRLMSTVIPDLRLLVRDSDGQRHDTAFDNTTYECVLNGVKPSPCFLFARKFASSQRRSLNLLQLHELGY